MNKRLRTILNIILILVALTCALVLLRQQLNWRDSAAARSKASEIVHASPSPSEPEQGQGAEQNPAAPVPGPATGSEDTDPVIKDLAAIDLPALQEVNPDVIGWITIPGADISHPLLLGPDNDYYLRHTWEKKWNGGGSIFLDCRASGDLEDFHTVIYGHRMRNGAMFAPLSRYAEQTFWAEHPYIYVTDGARVRRYEIFAAWEPSVTSLTYASELDSEESRQEMIDQCLGGSVIDTGVIPTPEDKLLTLSTCTGSGHATRWVVQARLEETYPAQ